VPGSAGFDAYAGDLAKPLLGLAPEVWGRLCGELDTVVHNGALVNHAFTYEELFQPNVLGTAEVTCTPCCHATMLCDMSSAPCCSPALQCCSWATGVQARKGLLHAQVIKLAATQRRKRLVYVSRWAGL
jgi:thioester reductase-like protein